MSSLFGNIGLSSFLASTLIESAIRGNVLPLRVLSELIGVSSSFYLLGSNRPWDLSVDFTRVEKTWWISLKLTGNLSSGYFCFIILFKGRGAFRIMFYD